MDSIIDSGEIKVSKKTLLHVSEGIYRSVGSALKEVVNNSFDAKATTVNINTNFPQYDFLSIKDDGHGMELNEFIRIVEGGIGDSKKSVPHKSERPIIGRLGIGILAIAQVCRSFTLISHHEESKTAFKGKMIFNPSVDKVAKTEEIGKEGGYAAGKWELIEKPDYDPNKKGVLIYTDDLRLAYLKRFRDDQYRPEKNDTPLQFDRYFKKFFEEKLKPGGLKSIKELGAYHELIYELCILLPIVYINDGPVRSSALNYIDWVDEQSENFIKQKQLELSSYKFDVILDGINLRKSIEFPFPELRNGNKQECQLFYFSYDALVRNRKLKFKGYFFTQEHSLYPREINGLLIRIKNVGIGLHDSSFLGYDKIESPRDKWISGEVFIEDGLESALNIDRDSFNENDEHFYVLRREIHKKLKEDVFPYVRKKQSIRNKANRDSKDSELIEYKKEQIESYLSSQLKNIIINYAAIDDIGWDEKTRLLTFPEKFINPKLKIRRESFLNNLFLFISSVEQISSEKEAEQIVTIVSKIILS